MTADPNRRPSRNLQRRIRRRQAVTGEAYMTAAAAVQAEWERGQRYLSDPSVPADVAAAVRRVGFIPLEPLDLSVHWEWWCRCQWCDAVVEVNPRGHGYQRPGRCPYIVHHSMHVDGRCTLPAADSVVFEGAINEEDLRRIRSLPPQRAHRVPPRPGRPQQGHRPGRGVPPE
ncbi:hypothetical protein [Actinomadura bangladeshensis]|uniref:Uncharacterized protein n=1 Tax=Actinomadura bangladeshensis TaxID=453573 RepID=A0A6L9QFG9_9ACTN|nr:hypothetical protein [Actinomadura bangladeshensis]NEA23778.1 hypothetical protein [Actinomadura bangladeshensis]